MNRAANAVGITVVFALCYLISTALAADGTPTAAPALSPFETLVKDTGLPYAMVDETAAAVIQEGTNIPVHELIVQLVDTGSQKAIHVYDAVAQAQDARDWPPEVFTWLLSRNWSYVRGSFALADQGLALVAIEKLSYEHTTSQSLFDALCSVWLAAESAYPDVAQYLKK